MLQLSALFMVPKFPRRVAFLPPPRDTSEVVTVTKVEKKRRRDSLSKGLHKRAAIDKLEDQGVVKTAGGRNISSALTGVAAKLASARDRLVSRRCDVVCGWFSRRR